MGLLQECYNDSLYSKLCIEYIPVHSIELIHVSWTCFLLVIYIVFHHNSHLILTHISSYIFKKSTEVSKFIALVTVPPSLDVKVYYIKQQ